MTDSKPSAPQPPTMHTKRVAASVSDMVQEWYAGKCEVPHMTADLFERRISRFQAIEPAQPDPVGYALAIEQAAQIADPHGSTCECGECDNDGVVAYQIRALTPPADRLAVVLAMPEVRAALEASYLAGFNSSGEGYNGEYPFQDSTEDPETDADWLAARSAALAALVQP